MRAKYAAARREDAGAGRRRGRRRRPRKAILALETELAKVQWTRVENSRSGQDLQQGRARQAGRAGAGLRLERATWRRRHRRQGRLRDRQPAELPEGLRRRSLATTPLATWKAYFHWQLLQRYAPYLSKAFVDEHFAFYGTVLRGVTETAPRWKRGVALVEGSAGRERSASSTSTQHFPAERKARMEGWSSNLLAAYKHSIDTLDWMSPETKEEAQAKLAKFTPKIGYPNKWRDYSTLEVCARTTCVGNVMRAHAFEYDRELAKLGKPIDRDEWGMTPQTVNAYYNPEMNEIVFPAAILQPPFFDADADDAVNYGGIGAVIGHEISHGFDDQGGQYDGDGNLRDWWTKADDKQASRPRPSAGRAVRRASSPVPGYHVNGELTLGENIADNSRPRDRLQGVQAVARRQAGAGDRRPHRRPALLPAAGRRCGAARSREAEQIRADQDRSRTRRGEFRANGTVRNQPGFYEAFGVKPGDKMYLPPKERVIMW